MTFIKRITVSGFRGIPTPLELSFVKGGKITSMAIFGRNGFGKSSLTDAWEWLQSDRISRLAREGAGPNAYPHRGAKDGSTYVQVDFATLGPGKNTFNTKKITMPFRDTVIDAFRKAAPYPCSLRYEDLTRFVYLTKAEQYGALAVLMGFTPQVEYQKVLRRVTRMLSEEESKLQALSDREKLKLVQIIGENPDPSKLLNFLKDQFVSANLNAPTSIAGASKALEGIEDAIKNDPRATALANYNHLRKCIADLQAGASIEVDINAYASQVEAFKNTEQNALDLILISLYEKGKEVVEQRALGEDAPCPLCGKTFEGSLSDHINCELASLQSLKSSKELLEASRKSLLVAVTSSGTLAKTLENGIKGYSVATELPLKDIVGTVRELDTFFGELRSSLDTPPERAGSATPSHLRKAAADLAAKAHTFAEAQKAILGKIDAEINILKDDGSRDKLVKASSQISDALKQWIEHTKADVALAELTAKRSDFQKITEHCIRICNTEIESRFNSISADVEKYFNILEEYTEGVGRPVLRLQMDQDRAVTLEIEFRGEPISPAYKYLSESQLNSFGLALFFAAARRFNAGFRFLILDDIVNSFDAYKRPQLVKLLKTEFAGFQFLLLTHDEVWCEQLFSSFPQWIRKRITRYDMTAGPILQDGLCELEKVERDLDDDQPSRAGQLLGPMLERELQELCESFEALVTYNRRNEYTLKPLLLRLIARVKEKLKGSHKLSKALEELDTNLSFRNLCAHWKNPANPLTTPEVREVLRIWKDIVAMVKCTEEKCTGYAKYDKDFFACSCKKLILAKGDVT